MISKEGQADSILRYERNRHIFFENLQLKRYFLLPTPLAKINLFTEWLSYIMLPIVKE